MVSEGRPSRVKVGCCGFARGRQDYFRHFRLVEVQPTFYKMPKLETGQKWWQVAHIIDRERDWHPGKNRQET